MKIFCTNHAYDIVTGEKRFTKGKIYPTKITEDSIYALDDKGDWTAVSAKVGTYNLLENEIFKYHFEVLQSQNFKLRAI